MVKHLHIICLDVPYPVNHGGLFDLFYKLQALQQEGVRVHLHCFEYGRGQQPELNKYCESVHYYKRRTGMAGFSLTTPYIVNSRKNEELLQRLLQDDHPILMEGIHGTWPLNDHRFANRKMFVRLHNVEYEYYRELSKPERSFSKKLYFKYESWLLKKYESRIANKAMFLAVSERDAVLYRNKFHAKVEYLPVFLPWDTVESCTGSGQFCLYHGNLSVIENEMAALWLLKHVFTELKTPFVIAGKDPSQKLQHVVKNMEHVNIVANPGVEEMQDLIKKAHINVLPAFNVTGVKLKMLNSLFVGRHCITNIPTECCHIEKTPEKIRATVQYLMQREFTASTIADRAAILSRIYNKQENCRKLIEWIW